MNSNPDARPITLVVKRKSQIADDIYMFELRSASGGELPPFTPGSHITVTTPSGQKRRYSLCNDSQERDRYVIAVKQEKSGRGGSLSFTMKIQEGDEVIVESPANEFVMSSSEPKSYVFIAGGIGITPILPMIVAAEAAGTPWTLDYGGRTRASMAFRDELRSRYGDRVVLQPQDERGLLDLDELLGEPSPDTLVYCCGPEPLLAAVESRCARWPEGALHVERFAPRPAELEPEPAGPAAAAEAFEVELARSGMLIRVSAETSILRAVEAAGVQVLSSCTEGICGTCETAVLGGVPDHRDSLLTPAERSAGDTMMICVSRSATPRLALDL
jgi:ferredoxin-NADP reductase